MKYILERLNRIYAKEAPPNKIGKKVTKKGLEKISSHKDIKMGEVVQAQKGYLYRNPKDGKIWYCYLRAWLDSDKKKIKGPYWYRKRRLGPKEFMSSPYGKTKGPGDVVDKYIGKKLPFKIPGSLSTNPATLPRSVVNILSKSMKIADKLRELA